MPIAILNYGVGNVKSISNALNLIGYRTEIITNGSELESKKPNFIILPGVGSFDFAASKLAKSGIKEAIQLVSLESSTRVLGICLGLQLLLDGSEEGNLEGLGLIPGIARKFDFAEQADKFPIPHMGWNTFKPKDTTEYSFLKHVSQARFYFAHSYYASLENPKHQLASTEYGFEFPSIISNQNVAGFQFHPEKSLKSGLFLLDRYLRFVYDEK